jgi:hypothetical protein
VKNVDTNAWSGLSDADSSSAQSTGGDKMWSDFQSKEAKQRELEKQKEELAEKQRQDKLREEEELRKEAERKRQELEATEKLLAVLVNNSLLLLPINSTSKKILI